MTRIGPWVGVMLLLVGGGPRRAIAADACLDCHATLGDRPSALYRGDIHHAKGIACSGCHGGDATSSDMERAMSREAGFIGRPAGDSLSIVCARCHSDAGEMKTRQSTIALGQYELLQQSVHGKLATNGRSRIVQCTTCHGAHGIVPVKDPRSPVHPRNLVATCSGCHSNASYMRAYNPSLPVDQREKYVTSVHGARNAAGDDRAAECASCHGSHGILATKDVRSPVYPTNLPRTCAKCHSDAAYMKGYGIPTDQFDKYARSVHGTALLERNDLGAPACNSCHGNHGATPPGVSSISKVCGTCHSLNSELFSASPHKAAFDSLKVPECETCHGNHEIVAATASLVGVGTGATCTRCHTDGSAGYRNAVTMRRLIDSLDAGEAGARGIVDEAEQKGMEVGEAKFRLREIRQARLESRTTVHAFNEGKMRTVVEKGLGVAAWVQGEGTRAIDEYYFRRLGLGISTLIITVLAVTLYIFIRRLEKEQQKSESTIT